MNDYDNGYIAGRESAERMQMAQAVNRWEDDNEPEVVR